MTVAASLAARPPTLLDPSASTQTSSSSGSLSAHDFAAFSDFLRRKSAISLAPGKEYLVESRLAPVAAQAGLTGVTELLGILQRPFPDPSLVEAVVEAMTTNETSFFRDLTSFEALRSTVLPELVARRGRERKLSIWSAASSTGQELYTIAMTLDDLFPETASWDLTLHGTDLSAQAVERARQGRYTPLEVNRGLPAPLLVKYFERDGRHQAVASRLRERTRFERMNLAEPWPVLPRFDIVFCRNVLIYFDPPVREQILARIRSVLAPGGYLFLGPGETSASVLASYTQLRVSGTIVHQLEGATRL